MLECCATALVASDVISSLAYRRAARWCHRGPACASLALDGANGGACSVIALLVAVVPVQGGGVVHIIFGAAPFLYLGVTWCVGVVLLGLWVLLLCDWHRGRLLLLLTCQ
jgi:hypothetical protein